MRRGTLRVWLLLLLFLVGCGRRSISGGASPGKIAVATPCGGPHSTIFVCPVGGGEYPLFGELWDGDNWRCAGWGCPRWSRDGSRLAVVDWDTMYYGGSPYGREGMLYVVNANGTRLTDLTLTNSCAAWSPDGRNLLFYYQGTLYVMDVKEKEATALTQLQLPEGVWSWAPDWSPDGTRIIYSAEDAIWEIRSDGTGPVRLVGPCEGCHFLDLRYSPDGEQIVFVWTWVSEDKPDGIHLMNRDGSEVTLLYSGGLAPRWSPDGRQIAFDSDEGVMVMNADGTGVRELVVEKRCQYGGFDWGP